MKSFKQFLKENIAHPMIDVDGVQKHRHNSDGKPIHHTDDGNSGEFSKKSDKIIESN